MTAAKRLAGFEERMADVRGTRLRYYVGGGGPPLVLVHGLGGAAVNWIDVAPPLAERRRVLVPDLPGHGGSSPVPALPNLHPFADAIRELAWREEMLPAAVVGHSLGALVALRLALRHPRDTLAVVLVAAAGISTSTRVAQIVLTLSALAQPGKRLAPYRRRIASSPFLRALAFGGWGVADARALPPHSAEAFLEGAALYTDVASAAAALVGDDPRPDLERVRCPALVVWGAEDRQVPVSDAFEYARALGGELRVVADCGHLLLGERPDACVAAIEDFLSRER